MGRKTKTEERKPKTELVNRWVHPKRRYVRYTYRIATPFGTEFEYSECYKLGNDGQEFRD